MFYNCFGFLDTIFKILTEQKRKEKMNHFDQKTNFEQSECVLIWLYNFGLVGGWTLLASFEQKQLCGHQLFVCVWYVCVSRTASNTQYERAAVAVGWWNKFKFRNSCSPHSGIESQDSHIFNIKAHVLWWMSLVFARYHRKFKLLSKETLTQPTYTVPSY